ncbi:hypothetical protein BJ322DRAFT_1112308 [Thelephora terrestris]|uniref:Restriction of telomere capping protein 4 n=1 Tax=Thelephora terrestris TaxID=56493 RepID=A0A9P6L2W8_9AGAM|nr:hypothetical protein BJ322DRAFT_1112308 [Thelephora terrestris]
MSSGLFRAITLSSSASVPIEVAPRTKLKISLASAGAQENESLSEGRTSVELSCDGVSTIICTLIPPEIVIARLDIVFEPRGSEIRVKRIGSLACSVHLSGYTVRDPAVSVTPVHDPKKIMTFPPQMGPRLEQTTSQIPQGKVSGEGIDPLSELVEDGLLCPFCDRKLQGDEFSPSLKKIWEDRHLSTQTWPSPLLWNPNHRESKAFQVHLDFCQQHRLEEKLLPLAHRRGWPIAPNFSEVPKRIKSIAPGILKLVDNICNNPGAISGPARKFYDNAAQKRVTRGPDMSQLRTQSAGYYGEPGYRITMETLYRLFNPRLISLHEKLPFTSTKIIERILFPQVIATLIAEDLDISIDQAVTVAEESGEFGRKYHIDKDV